MTPIIVAKNELRLVRTEQRLDKTVPAKKEYLEFDYPNSKIFIKNERTEERDQNSINVESKRHVKEEQASRTLLK